MLGIHSETRRPTRIASGKRFNYTPPSGPTDFAKIAPNEYGAVDVQDWRELSACFGMDQTIFFGPHEDDTESEAAKKLRVRVARGICNGCEVRHECLDFALTIGERFGIWGGKTAQERRQIRRRS